MNLRNKVLSAAMLTVATMTASTVPIILTAPEGSGLKVEYDAPTNVYTLTAVSAGQKLVRTQELEAPFNDAIRYFKFDYITSAGFSDINVTLYKCGSKGTSTQTRTFTGQFTAGDEWQPYYYDVRALRRVNAVKLGNNAGQYQDFEFNGLQEGTILKIRNIRWGAEEEAYKLTYIQSGMENTIEAEDFNQSNVAGMGHSSHQAEYVGMQPYKNPTGDKFPIFAWCGPEYRGGLGFGENGIDLGAVDLQRQYRDMAECGFNSTLGSAYPGVDEASLFTDRGVNSDVPVHLLEGLDVKLIVKSGFGSVKDGYDGDYSRAAMYKNSPYLAGYLIEDEPHMQHLPGMRRKVEKLSQYDTDHLFYGNLLHIHTDMPAIGAKSYEHYVSEYVRQVGLGFLSFDYYAVRQYISTGKTILMPDYCKNLEVIAKMSKYYNIPFWAFGQSVKMESNAVPGMECPTPTEESLRVGVFLALAYGAQGIQHFTYGHSNNYQDSPIDGKGERTPTWYLVQAVNRDIIALNDVLLGAEMVRVGYTHAKTPEGCMRLTTEMLPQGVASVAADSVCVSLLQNGTKQYMMIVNPSLSATQDVTVDFASKMTQIQADGTPAEVSGQQKTALKPGRHLVYLVNENAPEIEKFDQPAPFERTGYRTDAADVIITAADAASGGHYIPEMGDRRWNIFAGSIPEEANHVITAEDARAHWGATFNYFINVKEDMDVNITVGHSVPWSEYGRVASTGATPGYGYIVDNDPTLNWPKAYAASMILEIDGKDVTPADQPLRPAVPELFDPAGFEFNRILADKEQWVSTKNADGSVSDVLYFWPKEVGNDDIEFIYRDKPDYSGVHLTAGEHKIVVKSLCYPWHFDALKITADTGAGIGMVGAEESSEVVSSQYFDLQGRQLQGAPESGLYLRRDLRANGTSVTVKVVK